MKRFFGWLKGLFGSLGPSSAKQELAAKARRELDRAQKNASAHRYFCKDLF